MAESIPDAQSILVVDSDVLVRHAIADYLRHCGYVVVEASSTDEAVAALNEQDLRLDVVLCDAEAAGSQNAFQFRTWANQSHREVRVLLAGSADAVANKAAELCDEGPQLSRPYDPQSVVDYIRRLHGSAS